MKNNNIKWIGVIILLILCTIQAQAYVEVQYSEDNLTWMPLTNTSENTAFLNGLEADNKYFFRARNIQCDANMTALPFVYTQQRTEQGGLNEMELSIIIALVTFIGLAGFGSIVTSGFLRHVLILLTSLAVTFTLNVLANLTVLDEMGPPIGGDSGLIWFAYKISLYGFWIIALYCLITLTMNLKPAKKSINPEFESPLQRTKRMRKEKRDAMRGGS